VQIQFDPNQTFQLDAIEAVAGLFDGQPRGEPEFSVIRLVPGEGLFAGQERSELGIGNRLLVGDDTIRHNLRGIQRRNDIDVADENAAAEGWELFDEPAERVRLCPHFSVEMETGTGKTYVYLRTIFELSKRYGFMKFVIVVPSVAIREGVLKNIEITAEHFRSLYDNAPFEYFVYDAKRVNRLRQFALANTIQIAIINIDAFRKNFMGTEAERKSNVMYKESDRLSGRQPIEFIKAGRPIVIIDEPQSVDNTDRAQEAVKALNPLCTLRYSATHRNVYNLVYRLDPLRAFELRLVKQIVVASASASSAGVDAYVRVDAIEYKPALRAKLRIHAQSSDGPKPKTITVRNGHDLFVHSNERAAYSQGFSVAEINAEPGSEFVRFTNGRTMRIGQEIGGMRDDVWRAQIRHTIKKHLDREVQLQSRGIKVLSLFFIDRVSNYREYDADGHPMPGKIARTFEEELLDLSRDERYRSLVWLGLPIERLHNGYFASDKKERLKDSSEGRDTQADDDVYSLIMREKERLLSLDEPLRFIFTHSALREGWDNPNVFQICTLNEGRSAIKKRQEIGRGLRLPVDNEGKRVFDDSINKLWVMANESYEDFARALQTEYEDECGVTFGKVGLRVIAKLAIVVDGQEQPIGDDSARLIRDALIDQGMLESDGRIGRSFDPRAKGFSLSLPDELSQLRPAVVDLLSSYRIEKHIRRERDEGMNRLKKEVVLGPEFRALWERIKAKTTYRVEFDTDTLVTRASRAVAGMQRIEAPVVHVTAGKFEIKRAGILASAFMASQESVDLSTRAVPDILAYLQEQTELTRSTLVRILRESGRLAEFFVDPQRFMDAVAAILRFELHQLLIDGIKYERIQGAGGEAEWEMLLFKDEGLIDYLSAERVTKSVYEYVVYESEVEREFAAQLDARDDIKLFVKLPRWFTVDTPIGTYNPDWAIVRRDHTIMYLVRETKSTRDFLKLRTSEADKVRCGLRHFETLDVSFDVVTSAEQV
jgi:type III restriction enzyme